MTLCPSCAARAASRTCPVLGLELCGICCAERRRESGGCDPRCSHASAPEAPGRRDLRPAIRRHGAWRAPRLREFGGCEDTLEAVLDLEESICAYAAENPGLADGAVLTALDHLEAVAGGEAPRAAATELGLWLAECLRTAWEQEPGEGSLPGLLLLGLLAPEVRCFLVRRLRAIVGAEAHKGGYLLMARSYFEDLRSAEGGPHRSARRDPPERVESGQAP